MAAAKVEFVALALVAVLALSAQASVHFENCGTSTIGEVVNVDISGCAPGAPCKLVRGHNSTIGISFHSSSQVHQVQSVVHGVLHGLPMPFNFPYPDACSYGGLTCPLQPNTPLLYTVSLPILKIYPRVSVKIQWQLQDEDQNDVFCVRIPVLLV